MNLIKWRYVKVSSYIVQYPILRIAQRALFPDRPIRSNTTSTYLGSVAVFLITFILDNSLPSLVDPDQHKKNI